MFKGKLCRAVVSLFLLGVSFSFAGCPPGSGVVTEDIANEWMTLIRVASKYDTGAPTIEARLFYHFSLAMYESWAVYDETAAGALTGHRLKQDPEDCTFPNQAETLSHAVYELAKVKYETMAVQPPGSGARNAFDALTSKMVELGYLEEDGAIVSSDAQRLGKTIADVIINYGANDGANEANGFADTEGYLPVNEPILSNGGGTNAILDPNHWQPILLPNGTTQTYLNPHWGRVLTFAFGRHTQQLRFDPGFPPLLGTPTEQKFINDYVDVLRISHSLDPNVGPGAELVDLSPAVRGVTTPGLYETINGHPINPYTGLPYSNHMVPMGDYLRVLAMFLDGNTHNTPPPWWMQVAVDATRGEGLFTQRPSNKANEQDLEYDVKLFLMVSAAVHDAAVGIWDVKIVYDTPRPMTGIRYLAEAGLLPLEDGFIELVEEGDPLAGAGGEHVGEYKVNAWAGPNQGVKWMLASEWKGYQPPDFICPPFPGYVSGHTGMARAAAEAFKEATGDAYVPGGLAQWTIEQLPFEDNLSVPVTLQAATWQDMADEAAFGRLCSGVHTPSDLDGSKPLGRVAGQKVVALAREFFAGRGVALAK